MGNGRMDQTETALYDAAIASIRGRTIDYMVVYQRRVIAASDALFWTLGMKQKHVIKILSKGKNYVIVYRVQEVKRASTMITKEINEMIYGRYYG